MVKTGDQKMVRRGQITGPEYSDKKLKLLPESLHREPCSRPRASCCGLTEVGTFRPQAPRSCLCCLCCLLLGVFCCFLMPPALVDSFGSGD